MNTNLNPRQRNDSRSRRRGIMLIMFALLLAPLLALIGLTIDGGHIYFEKRRMQAAADGGAFGAAREIFRGNDGLVVSGGRDDAKLNGYDNALSDITVTVNRPPLSGPNSGNNNAAEVIIERPVATTFMKVILRQETIVRARAVAGVVDDPKPPCILALDPMASGAITVSGTADVLIPTCDVLATSKSSSAITVNGNINFRARKIGYGKADNSSWRQNGGGYVYPEPVGVTVPGDPYAGTTEPACIQPPIRTSKLQITGGTEVLVPGCYEGGIKITGGDVTLSPGVYYVNGFEVTGGSISGNGVMIFNRGLRRTDNIHIGGNVTVDLHGIWGTQVDSNPLILAEWENFLFFNSIYAAVGNGATSDATLLGDSYSVYDGIMYFPTITLNYGGTSEQSSPFAIVVANMIEFSGTPLLGANYGEAGRTPSTTQVSLLE